jgi:hypothetical protein
MGYSMGMNKTLFAFWKYDQFPFVLGGTVEDINEEGLVQTKEYGKGFWFNPVKMLPLKEGKELLAKLNNLDYERRKAMKVMDKQFDKKVKDLINFN